MKKMFKRILSALLVAVLLIGIAPMGGFELSTKVSAKDISSCKVGDIIEFGSYPQSEITDNNLIAKIEAAGKSISWVDYNYYAGTGDWDDGNMKPVDGMMLYKDIPCNGSKYRAVKINQYRPYITGYPSSESNSLQDDNGYYKGNIYYFKYEPLTWRVLSPTEGYVMCNSIIDSQAYQNFIYLDYGSKDRSNYASDWTISSLRQWLDNDFYNTTFTYEEKLQIGISHLENKNTYSSRYDNNDTYDKVFPISYYDATCNYGLISSTRQMKGTDYAKCQGLSVDSSVSCIESSCWRLRSPYLSLYTAEVDNDGQVDSRSYVHETFVGVVPAFKFNQKSTIPNKTGGTFIYGSYPQSKVIGSELIAKIEAAGKSISWVDYNYYAGTGNEYNGNMKPVDSMMFYKDITCGGSKYRAVKINQYRPYITGYPSSESNSFQNVNGYYAGNIYYFKYEPLTWRVLDPDEGYVMCNQIIDSQAYQNFIYYNGSEYYNSKDCTVYASDWATSSLRQWLNNDFYNTAFTAEEKAQIGTAHLKNKSKASSTYNGDDAYDKIFPISSYDAINSAYGFNSSMKGTDYAKCQGLDVYNDSGSSYNRNSWWWLRSPYMSSDVTIVYSDGAANYIHHVNGTSGGVVPAFKFNPKSTIPNKIGDINTDGKINSADALLVLQSSTGIITLTDTQKLLADVNKDGKINSTDALLILQYATGKITYFK